MHAARGKALLLCEARGERGEGKTSKKRKECSLCDHFWRNSSQQREEKVLDEIGKGPKRRSRTQRFHPGTRKKLRKKREVTGQRV